MLDLMGIHIDRIRIDLRDGLVELVLAHSLFKANKLLILCNSFFELLTAHLIGVSFLNLFFNLRKLLLKLLCSRLKSVSDATTFRKGFLFPASSILMIFLESAADLGERHLIHIGTIE
jgi:hypothetical protein